MKNDSINRKRLMDIAKGGKGNVGARIEHQVENGIDVYYPIFREGDDAICVRIRGDLEEAKRQLAFLADENDDATEDEMLAFVDSVPIVEI